jgi:hypothetical protein
MKLINTFKEKNNIEKSIIIFSLCYFIYLFYDLIKYELLWFPYNITLLILILLNIIENYY